MDGFGDQYYSCLTKLPRFRGPSVECQMLVFVVFSFFEPLFSFPHCFPYCHATIYSDTGSLNKSTKVKFGMLERIANTNSITANNGLCRWGNAAVNHGRRLRMQIRSTTIPALFPRVPIFERFTLWADTHRDGLNSWWAPCQRPSGAVLTQGHWQSCHSMGHK